MANVILLWLVVHIFLMYPENVDVSLGIESKDERTRNFLMMQQMERGVGGSCWSSSNKKRLDDAIEDKKIIFYL